MISDHARNYSPAQKRAALDRLYEEWLRHPDLRLGQLVYALVVGRHPQAAPRLRLPLSTTREPPANVGDLLFNVEDHDLLTSPASRARDAETKEPK